MTLLTNESKLTIKAIGEHQIANFEYHTLAGLRKLLDEHHLTLEMKISFVKSALKLMVNKETLLAAIGSIHDHSNENELDCFVAKEEVSDFQGVSSTFVTVNFGFENEEDYEVFTFHESGLQYDAHATISKNGF